MRPPRTDFKNYVSALPASEEAPLPLTHVTDAYGLRSVVDEGRISPTHCEVFNRDLLYLFYGRPAYRKNGEIQPNGLRSYCPTVFILDPKYCDAAIQMYPFDTGAYHLNVFSEFLHKYMQVRDFRLEVGIETPGKLVATFFGNNQGYYDRVVKQAVYSGSEFEVDSYQQLIGYKGQNSRDDRASSIELALADAVFLGTGVLAIVLPESIVDDAYIGGELRRRNIEIISYTDGPGFDPKSQTAYLYNLVRDYYKEIGAI